MSYRLMIQGVVCMHVVCSLLLAQRLPRERWGAPLVNVSREEGMWIVEGRKNRLSLRASDLAMTVQAGPVTWKMGPSSQKDMLVKSRGEECHLRLADAGRIEISPYDSGAKTGLKIRLGRFRHTGLLNRGLELDLALCLTACLEGKNEELACEAVAIEREASVRYLDWPREMDARDVDYRVTKFDELAQQLREMKSRGVDRAYVTLAGWPCLGYDRQHPDVLPPAPDAGGWEGLKRWVDTCKELGYLYNLHDQYRDYYVDAPSYDPQFAVHEEDATSRPTAFPGTRFGTWKEGCIPFMDYWDGGKMAYLNARFAPGHLIKNYQLIFDRGIRMQGSYLDVFGYVPPTEDFNPEHPLTRADCMEYRARCFRWVRNNLGIVGTEAGADWAVPYVDYARLVSRADLRYSKPVSRSEEGIPVGNGRMGSLVWTTPGAVRLQINRVDVFANNSYTTSFPARNSDYCGGCGFVDITFGGEVFTQDKTSQHLSCYDGLADVRGDAVAASVLAWNEQDVMAFEVSDNREQPAEIAAVLRMLRAPEVKTAAHTAVSKIEDRDGRIILTQKFTEADYYCGSAVAVGVVGRRTEAKRVGERAIQLVAEAGNGAFAVLIASAASFDPNEDIVAAALGQLAAAEKKGYAELAESNKRWWHDFWSKGYVRLHSEDGIADYVEQNYTYYLYVMASSSRGRFPAKFNGMIWTTGGDRRSWGGQYWGANQECMYNALLPTNRMELLDPMFDMYWGMYDSCATAARQQWGSQGIYIPETVAFDGLARLPDDIAAEMRDLYLLRKSWDQRSEAFLAVARTGQPHSSRWNWMGGGSYVDGVWQPTERGGGPYGPVTHIFSRGAKIAYTYWQRYEYTLDKTWLRDRAYPMLKGVAEFYRHYPNIKKGGDGKYHIHHVNSNESVQGGRDPDEEIASIMGILPAVIKASEILGVDAEMRPVWKEFLANLAPLPTGGSPPVWIRALPPVFRGRGDGRPDGNTMPHWFFDLCTLENGNSGTMRIADATMDGYLRGPDTRPGVLSKVGVTAAMMGRAEAVRYLLPNQLSFPDRAPILANRLDQREGTQTTNAQRLGRVADTLHNALMQSVGAGPAREPVIRVFPAWPREWDAAFSLLARGAFVVGSSMKAGRIEYVRIESRAGGECRLRNPWPGGTVSLERDGNKARDLSGDLLKFPTTKGEVITIRPLR